MLYTVDTISSVKNGSVLAEAKRFTNEIIYADIDVQKLAAERRKMTFFTQEAKHE